METDNIAGYEVAGKLCISADKIKKGDDEYFLF
jgi:hypothetical protein